MNVDRQVKTNVVAARFHTLKRSESVPMLSRPTMEAPFNNANASEELLALRPRDDAYAIKVSVALPEYVTA